MSEDWKSLLRSMRPVQLAGPQGTVTVELEFQQEHVPEALTSHPKAFEHPRRIAGYMVLCSLLMVLIAITASVEGEFDPNRPWTRHGLRTSSL
jgi:hypothetical protein